MLTFGAESPRDVIDNVTLTLAVDDQGFILLRLTIQDEQRRPVIQRTIRIGQPSALEIGTKMIEMATLAEPSANG
jgi:hypothetical protein